MILSPNIHYIGVRLSCHLLYACPPDRQASSSFRVRVTAGYTTGTQDARQPLSALRHNEPQGACAWYQDVKPLPDGTAREVTGNGDRVVTRWSLA
jgi:hypothetical protein